KTSSFRVKAVPQGRCQFERRMFPRDSVTYELFHPDPALKNPGAILTGIYVALYILLRFDRQCMVHIPIDIRPLSFPVPIVKVTPIHKSSPLVPSGLHHSHWPTARVLLAVASARGSTGTSPYPREYQASLRFPYKRTPERRPTE